MRYNLVQYWPQAFSREREGGVCPTPETRRDTWYDREKGVAANVSDPARLKTSVPPTQNLTFKKINV